MSAGTRFCGSCGKPVASDTKFCPSCGTSLPSLQAPPVPTSPAYQVPYQPPYQPSPPKSNTALIVAIILIVVVVVAVIGGILALGIYNVARTASTQQSYNIVNGLITVQPGGYNYYPFTVAAGATTVSVTGSFTASGGSGNDIDVFVTDQTNFVNWQNGHQATSFYNSGQLTTATISASLPDGGTYYLVYSNTFSSVSSKNVQTTANLSYYS